MVVFRYNLNSTNEIQGVPNLGGTGGTQCYGSNSPPCKVSPPPPCAYRSFLLIQTCIYVLSIVWKHQTLRKSFKKISFLKKHDFCNVFHVGYYKSCTCNKKCHKTKKKINRGIGKKCSSLNLDLKNTFL